MSGVKFGDNNINPNIGNPTLEATIAKPSVNVSFNAPAIRAQGSGTVVLENPQFFIGNVETLDAGEDVYCYLTGTRDAPVLNFGIPMGFKGDTGEAATIAVGTVTTGQPTDPASVTNSGTSSAAVFDFVIPKGADGTDGEDGVSPAVSIGSIAGGHTVTITDADHPTGQTFNVMDGTDGQDGQDGQDGISPTATVSKVGDTATITITDKNGTTTASISDGQDGQDGQDGAAATIAVGTVTTGAAGSSATVVNSGTSSAAVFDFTIPKGDTGAAGQGVPSGGSAGQVLKKVSGTDYDTEWATDEAGAIPDWEEDDPSDPSYIQNRPDIRAGTGTNSIVMNQLDGNNIAAGNGSVVIGQYNEATSNATRTFVAGGHNEVVGTNNIVAGVANRVLGRENLVVGRYGVSNGSGRDGVLAGSCIGGYINITGAANATTYTYDTLPYFITNELIASTKIFSLVTTTLPYRATVVTSIDTSNNTLVVDRTISDTAITNYKMMISVPNFLDNTGCVAVGNSVQTTHNFQLVVGQLNDIDDDAVLVVGNGDPTVASRSNAFVVHEDGTANFQSTASAGTVATPATVTNANDLTTKAYVDAAIPTVPTNVSAFTNDAGYITGYTETDPVFLASAAHGISSSDITAWNNKSDFSGNYNDLTNKPTIPTVPTNVSAFTNDAGYLTSYTETDPTVPSWAKQSTKPSYTASEVGSLADTTKYALSTSIGGSAKNTEGIPFGEVASTSTSTAFTATVAGITELKDGTVVMLKNGVVTSAANFTININGLGAKPVYSNMATGNGVTPTAPTRETTIFNINYTLFLVYSTDLVDGGAWINYRGYNSDTNTIGYQLRTNSTVMKTADASRYYRMFFTSADGTHWVPANTAKDNSATSTKTVNQRKINPFGRIIYFSYTTNMSAESDVPAAYCWEQYAFSFGYSFNRTGAALTLTTKTPVYIKCAPQSDGSAIIDSTTPYVQSLPSTADGKIYIFLGVAYSATNIELYPSHPVYYHDGTSIKLWTGKAIPTKTSELTNDSGFLTSAPVTSVNGQTGTVVVSELPTVTSSDNGKVLRVVNGAWAAASLPSANGVNF